MSTSVGTLLHKWNLYSLIRSSIKLPVYQHIQLNSLLLTAHFLWATPCTHLAARWVTARYSHRMRRCGWVCVRPGAAVAVRPSRRTWRSDDGSALPLLSSSGWSLREKSSRRKQGLVFGKKKSGGSSEGSTQVAAEWNGRLDEHKKQSSGVMCTARLLPFCLSSRCSVCIWKQQPGKVLNNSKPSPSHCFSLFRTES